MKPTMPGIIIIILTVFLQTQTAEAMETIPIFVSIVPQKYFVERIGGDRVNVRVMVEPGTNPHFYEPKPGQMIAISRTKIYFAIGGAFEDTWLEKIVSANTQMQVVHTDKGIEKIPMASLDQDGDGERHHGEDGHQEKAGHHHGGLDPHIWLSPPLVMKQARTIFEALKEADPAHEKVYEANFKDFMMELGGLDAGLRKIFTGKKNLQFMVFHPSWGYFAHAYGLEQVPVEVEGKHPKPAQLKKLIKHARKNNIKVIFVQPQFSSRSAEMVAREIGGYVVAAYPLAADWFGNLREVADKFRDASR